MANLLSNMLLDGIGITKAVLYRTFVQRQWGPPQPMFNINTVKPGDEVAFELFLKQALGISMKAKTPISLGPYKSASERAYVYVTHYASTLAFMRVMAGLTLTGVVMRRVGTMTKGLWTYCAATSPASARQPEEAVMVGVQGDSAPVINFLNLRGVAPFATVSGIKNVRGKALGTYLLYENNAQVQQLLQQLIQEGATINTLTLNKLNQ